MRCLLEVAKSAPKLYRGLDEATIFERVTLPPGFARAILLLARKSNEVEQSVDVNAQFVNTPDAPQ